jgi:hypothetical protein
LHDTHPCCIATSLLVLLVLRSWAVGPSSSECISTHLAPVPTITHAAPPPSLVPPPPPPVQVWRPGVDPMAEDEELDYDPTAYDCLHKFALEWPCLSFDFVRDELGGPRSTFPHTVFMVAGTQVIGALGGGDERCARQQGGGAQSL